MTGTTPSKLTVFSDLDGTLLDHDTYSWEPARPAIDALAEHNIPLVLASSKTAAEMEVLQAEMGISHWPALVENGAGCIGIDGFGTKGGDYDVIRAALGALPKDLRQAYRGFGDMTVADVADITGLPIDRATNAKKRLFSEPGLWSGSDAQLAEFEEDLKNKGIHMRSGGRFLTLSLGRTKADGLRDVAAYLKAETTLALGDAPNDAEMLEAADHGVIIRNDHAPKMPDLPGLATGKIRKSQDQGPVGWNQMVLDFVGTYVSKKVT